jgi:hypothetical protein
LHQTTVADPVGDADARREEAFARGNAHILVAAEPAQQQGVGVRIVPFESEGPLRRTMG